MTATTVLTTWSLGAADFRNNIIDSLTDFGDDFDIEGLIRAYADAIDAVLPDGLSLALNGDVTGPADWTGDATQALQDAVEEVDFWALAARYDRTLSAE